jgi:hypothetical protein
MNLGLDIIRRITGPLIVYERATLEGLMDTMQRVTIKQVNGANVTVPDGSVFIVADELSNLFGKSQYITDLMSFLTAAYTCRPQLQFLTRNHGLCSIKNPCPCVLAGTTPDQFGEIFPASTATSGFLARVVLVSGERSHRKARPKINSNLVGDLIHDLVEISKLDGEFVLSQEANDEYTNWYENLPDLAPNGVLESFYERYHDHVLKIAIVLSAAESDDKIISIQHLCRARDLITNVIKEWEISAQYIGALQSASVVDKIYTIIASSPTPVEYSQIMNRMYRRIKNPVELKDYLDILKESDKIEEIATPKKIMYKMKWPGRP